MKVLTIDSPEKALLAYIAYLVIAIGLSTLIYKYYEKPMTDMRDKKLRFTLPSLIRIKNK